MGQFLEDTNRYGDIPNMGGLGAYSEYSMAIGRVIEEIHCIVGSVKQDVYHGKSTSGGLSHICEELALIKRELFEYYKPVYLDLIRRKINADKVAPDILQKGNTLKKILERSNNLLDKDKDVPDNAKKMISASFDFIDFIVDKTKSCTEESNIKCNIFDKYGIHFDKKLDEYKKILTLGYNIDKCLPRPPYI